MQATEIIWQLVTLVIALLSYDVLRRALGHQRSAVQSIVDEKLAAIRKSVATNHDAVRDNMTIAFRRIGDFDKRLLELNESVEKLVTRLGSMEVDLVESRHKESVVAYHEVQDQLNKLSKAVTEISLSVGMQPGNIKGH